MSLFSAVRILLLLFVYDIAFIYISILFENDLDVCVGHALLTTMIVLGVLACIRTVEKIITIKIESYHAELSIQQELKKEYAQARKQKIKNKLILNHDCPNKKRLVLSDEGNVDLAPSNFRFIQIDYSKKTSL